MKLLDPTVSWKLSIAIKVHEQVDVFDITIKLNACVLISVSTCVWLKILIEREKKERKRAPLSQDEVEQIKMHYLLRNFLIAWKPFSYEEFLMSKPFIYFMCIVTEARAFLD